MLQDKLAEEEETEEGGAGPTTYAEEKGVGPMAGEGAERESAGLSRSTCGTPPPLSDTVLPTGRTKSLAWAGLVGLVGAP
jgi:hypothetical protein